MKEQPAAQASNISQHTFARSCHSTNMSTADEALQPTHSDISSSEPASSNSTDKAFCNFHHHNLSGSTASASSDSSPTTTCSTVDDSSATEPSPGSSPESPPPSTFSVGMLRSRMPEDANSTSFFELQRTAAPTKKGRNLKNLAVNTSRTPDRPGSMTSLPAQSQRETSDLSILSPSFVKPPTPPKRRPSNLGLTIRTPSTPNPASKHIRLAIPPTPGFGKPGTLRHFQSSPSLPLLHTSFAPQAGAAVPIFEQPSALDSVFSPIDSRQTQPVQDDEQNFDVPLSREEKPDAYPDGPICVYEPYIDLYLEPTAEQARTYDVILNVASEVRNPFLSYDQPISQEPQMRLDGGGGIQFAPKRDPPSATTETFSTAPSSPTTPKATPLAVSFESNEPIPTQSDPEYIHIPWEHNSDIVPDLLRLAKLIDERVKQNKRVLVHCQCGVSRSASLVVAYGLYKNPTMSVQEAYDAVKQKSKWIGPNMNLIMQLQEFRSSLARGGILSGNRCLTPVTPSSALSEWGGPFSHSRPSDFGPHAGGLSSPFQPSSLSKDEAAAVTPGPSSAPSGTPWPKDAQPRSARSRAVSAVRTPSTYVDPSGHVVPILSLAEALPPTRNAPVQLPPLPKEDSSATPTEALPSPRSSEFAMTGLQPSEDVTSADFFGILSPTSTEFTSSPFDRSTLLAQLGMGSVHEQPAAPTRSKSHRKSLPPQEKDTSSVAVAPSSRLRGKISSPNLREQQQLHNLQAQIEAQLPHRQPVIEESSSLGDALMSPRATEFTANPFALAFTSPPPVVTGETTRVSDVDPRSPAQKGASPITRNIEDVL